MSKKILSLILLIPLLAGCALPAQLTAKLPFLSRLVPLDCDLLRVGILTGAEDDPIAQEQLDGYALALQQINDGGGIAGCQLQVFYQTEDDSDQTAANSRLTYQALRTLVEDNQVIALLGGTSDEASMAAASLANYFNVPMLVPSAGGAHVLPENNRWGFRLHVLESAYAGLVFETVRQEFDAGVQTVIIFEDSNFGHDAAIAAVNAAKANEQEVTGYFAYDPAQTGAEALAKQVFELQPQLIYLAFENTTQAENVLLALQKEKGMLSVIEVARAGGFASHEFLQNSSDEAKDAAGHLILATRWSGDASGGDADFAASFSAYTQGKYGQAQQPTLYNAEAYKSLMIVADTLKSMLASATQPPTEVRNIREDLRQALFNYKEVSPVWGSIDFSGGGQNQSGIALLQMFDGEWQVVYPSAKAQNELYFDYQPR